ncbi:TRAP-type C4-dicarboxylate transport system permease small subunit [Rhodovulum bhavnagarense]|uniref:TRAP transporter small permease protein n=1 Tax=Rhodovulum bhavnagarense TaxID=992286 RepID=A0A4R2RPU9_9RHOB|nr:TRAP transporter small permease [Rhodovulum bhavnagarense]TCP61861.1 TRAP-type C4-dicarboxylate transport system permease small subunit [Rhodovulum bhavnagarense]
MRQVFQGVGRGLRVLGQLVLAFMVVTICYDAIMRYVFTAPTSWSLEINTFLIIFVALLTAADAQRSDSHIRITFFSDMAGAGGRRVIRALIGLIGALFCAIMAWRGFLLAWQAWEYGERVSSGFGTPMVLPYGLLPVGFGMLAVQFLLDALDAAFWPDRRGERDEIQNI